MARGNDERWNPARQPAGYSPWKSEWGGASQTSWNDTDPNYPDMITATTAHRDWKTAPDANYIARAHIGTTTRSGDVEHESFQAGPFKTQGRAMVAAGALANRARGNVDDPKLGRYRENYRWRAQGRA